MKVHHRALFVTAFVLTIGSIAGCQTLQQIAQLRNVGFAIDRVSAPMLAGIDLSRMGQYQDLRPLDIVRLGSALSERQLPLQFRLHVAADNPEANNVAARLVRMDWTLFLEGRETVSGRYNDEVLLPPGQRTDVPIDISLDLVQFFGDNLRDLVDVALAVSGQEGETRNIELQATPIIDTSLGPISYPRPITIVSHDVGNRQSN